MSWSASMASHGGPHHMPHALLGSSLYSPDGRYCVVVMTHQVRVYFIQTRQCVKTVELDCSQVCDTVVRDTHVLLFTYQGEILTLSWKDRSHDVTKTDLGLDEPLLSVVSADNDTYTVVCGKRSRSWTPHPRSVVVVSANHAQTVAEIENCILYAVSSDRKVAVFVTTSTEALVYDVGQWNDGPEVLKFTYKSHITAVAVSNSKMVAMGSESGPIQVLYGGLDEPQAPKVLKWHVDTVTALAFSPDNQYLLSGGQEKVLVFWHLDSNKNQFLPRLNGTIAHIGVDSARPEYYSMVLQHGDHHEVVVLSAVDLVSRLAVSSIRPHFYSRPHTVKKMAKKVAKMDNFDPTVMRHDYSAPFAVHPGTHHVYIPNQSAFQAYDVVKNEQVFVQHAAPVLSTGKVRSEHKLVDPTLTALSFTPDGQWMATFDSVETSEIDNLLSKHDKQFALKFWKYVPPKQGAPLSSGSWELTTKIMEPHGAHPVVAVVPAPVSYHDGRAFLTADNKGGLRLWRPRDPVAVKSTEARGSQTAWTMRKAFPSGAVASESVDAAWSDDGSVIVRALESQLQVFNAHTFAEIPQSQFCIPALTGSHIRAVAFAGSCVVVLSKTRISSFDMLTGATTELVARVNTQVGGRNMMAVDPVNGLVCIALNYYVTEPEFAVHSKLVVFDPTRLEPVCVREVPVGIAAVRYSQGQFIYIDIDSRIGVLTRDADQGSHAKSLADDMAQMVLSAQVTADIIASRVTGPAVTRGGDAAPEPADGGLQAPKPVELATIQPIFEHAHGVGLETLFERIVKVIK
ncbi:NET1-associated nuclear protein 1 [Diutina catenulata]